MVFCIDMARRAVYQEHQSRSTTNAHKRHHSTDSTEPSDTQIEKEVSAEQQGACLSLGAFYNRVGVYNLSAWFAKT